MPLVRRHPRRTETNVSMVKKHFRRLAPTSNVPHGDRENSQQEIAEDQQKFTMEQTSNDIGFKIAQLEKVIEHQQAISGDVSVLEHQHAKLLAQKDFLDNQREKFL